MLFVIRQILRQMLEVGHSTVPHGVFLSFTGADRSFVNSIITRMAIDVASVEFYTLVPMRTAAIWRPYHLDFRTA